MGLGEQQQQQPQNQDVLHTICLIVVDVGNRYKDNEESSSGYRPFEILCRYAPNTLKTIFERSVSVPLLHATHVLYKKDPENARWVAERVQIEKHS